MQETDTCWRITSEARLETACQRPMRQELDSPSTTIRAAQAVDSSEDAKVTSIKDDLHKNSEGRYALCESDLDKVGIFCYCATTLCWQLLCQAVDCLKI
jgi:hypothetical protein